MRSRPSGPSAEADPRDSRDADDDREFDCRSLHGVRAPHAAGDGKQRDAAERSGPTERMRTCDHTDRVARECKRECVTESRIKYPTIHAGASRRPHCASTRSRCRSPRGTPEAEREQEVPTLASTKEMRCLDTLVIVLLVLILLAVTGHLHL